jgi:hypothetical protein
MYYNTYITFLKIPQYLLYVFREKNISYVKNLWLKGLGIGNGFISAEDQSLYADYVNALTYLTESQYEEFQEYDNALLKALEQKNYSDALVHSQKALHFLVSEVMNLTNIYDFTYNENFLTNHEYVCYLQQPRIRQAIHAGNAAFNKGMALFFNQNIMSMAS